MKKSNVLYTMLIVLVLVLCVNITIADEVVETVFAPEIQEILDNLTESQGLKFFSNGDGTCKIVGIGTCTDKTIVIPAKSPNGDTVTMIDKSAFYDCEDVVNIVFSNLTLTVDDYAFQGCELERLIVDGCTIEFDDRAFYYCEDIEEIHINNSTIETGEYVFYDGGDKATVTFTNSNIVLGDYAFQGFEVIDLEISDCEIEICDRAFYYCEDIDTINFTNNIMEIGEYAFYDGGDEATITIANCKLEADSYAFQGFEVVVLVINDCNAELKDRAFYYCEGLETVTIGNGNISIGEYAFYECTDLKEVVIGGDSKDNEIELDDYVFQGCRKLEKAMFGNGQIEIGDRVFYYCEKLNEVTINSDDVKIGENVFYQCPISLVITIDGQSYNQETIEDR